MAGDTRAVTLRELLTTTKDGDWGKDTPAEGLLPYFVIRGTDFPSVRVGDTSSVPVRYLSQSTVHRRTLAANDILIETAGGSPERPTGRSLLITQKLLDSLELPATCASFARFLRVDRSKVEPTYVFWFLQHLYANGEMEQHQVQHTGVARFQYTKFSESQEIQLPRRDEQRVISSILGALDDKIELNLKMSTTLEAMARAIFWARELEESWPETRLGDVCEIYDGPHATPKLVNAGPIFLGISNLADGLLDMIETKHLSDDDFLTWTRRVTPSKGDVVFSYETRLGQAALIPEGLKCCLGRRMALLRTKPGKVDPVVLMRAYLAPEFQETIRQRTIHGSTVDRIPLKEMAAFPIRLPQGRAMVWLADQLRPLRGRVEHNERERDTLVTLRDQLLHRLVSGRLRVSDAERQDEPAVA